VVSVHAIGSLDSGHSGWQRRRLARVLIADYSFGMTMKSVGMVANVICRLWRSLGAP
jgi:hypothetical protein